MSNGEEHEKHDTGATHSTVQYQTDGLHHRPHRKIVPKKRWLLSDSGEINRTMRLKHGESRSGAAVFVGRGRGGRGWLDPGRLSQLRLLAFRTAPCGESEGRRSDSPPRNLYFNSTRASVYAKNTHTAQRRHKHKPPNDTLLLIFFLAARAVMSSWWRPPLSLQ